LNSKQAIETNIRIIRVFTKMREMLLTHKDILLKLEQFEKQTVKNSEDIQIIFNQQTFQVLKTWKVCWFCAGSVLVSGCRRAVLTASPLKARS
jgi:hypothetical protein